MRFLVDVNLSPKWVALFEQEGYEAIRWTEVGKATASDRDIMTYAQQKDYVVLTHDQDFNTLLALSRQGKPSVVLMRLSSLRVERVGERVVRAIRITKDELRSGAIIVIEDHRVRVRELPLISDT